MESHLRNHLHQIGLYYISLDCIRKGAEQVREREPISMIVFASVLASRFPWFLTCICSMMESAIVALHNMVSCLELSPTVLILYGEKTRPTIVPCWWALQKLSFQCHHPCAMIVLSHRSCTISVEFFGNSTRISKIAFLTCTLMINCGCRFLTIFLSKWLPWISPLLTMYTVQGLGLILQILYLMSSICF